MMGRKAEIGEFEQLVLLAAVRLDEDAYAPEIARVLEEGAGREMSRGTLYAALERLEARGFLTWQTESPTPDRSGSRRRKFSVTRAGSHALAASRRVLLDMWDGIENLLPEIGS
jgi:DNA-binding PadR family transcriptional regulator